MVLFIFYLQILIEDKRGIETKVYQYTSLMKPGSIAVMPSSTGLGRESKVAPGKGSRLIITDIGCASLREVF